MMADGVFFPMSLHRSSNAFHSSPRSVTILAFELSFEARSVTTFFTATFSPFAVLVVVPDIEADFLLKMSASNSVKLGKGDILTSLDFQSNFLATQTQKYTLGSKLITDMPAYIL